MKKANDQNRIFTEVDYRQFRLHLADIATKTVEGKGYETIIYDRKGDIQAILHAASIDSNGQCHPAEYFIRTSALPVSVFSTESLLWQVAA